MRNPVVRTRDTFESDTTSAAETLWNFYNASTLNFGAEFGGSVLAPDAAVDNSSPIDGDLIANSFTGSAELHNYPFTGNLTFAVPEPGSFWLLLVGIAGLIVARPRAGKPPPGPTPRVGWAASPRLGQS